VEVFWCKRSDPVVLAYVFTVETMDFFWGTVAWCGDSVCQDVY
jgi:hypothetical protein